MRYAPALAVGPIGKPKLSRDGRTMVVSVPLELRRRCTRKRVTAVAPSSPRMLLPARVDETIVKAIVRARRWQAMLESGKFLSTRQLAKAEKINESYVCRYLRLALLSPAIIEMALDGTLPTDADLSALLKLKDTDWRSQEAAVSALSR